MSASEPARERRLLILAEGFSGDPHYGKTMRGVLRYRRDDVVAILDSTRAGGDEEGIPIVAAVASALPLRPTAALVGVATQGGRFPPAWAIEPAWVGGCPGLVVHDGDRLVSTLSCEVAGGRIVRITAVLNPRKLAGVERDARSLD